MLFNIPSPLLQIHLPISQASNIEVWMKRDDLIHSEISGNKWRKLKFNIEKFKQGQYDAILTFGGAFSNHIAATAFAGKELNIPTIGIIRGEELNQNSNSTIQAAHQNGMDLHFVSRTKYKERYEKIYWTELRNRFGNILIIEEGGANFHGLLGCSEVVSELPFEPDYILTAAGTGTTSAGLLFTCDKSEIISVPVLKKGTFIKDEIKELLYYSGLSGGDINLKLNQLKLETRFHFGGYGKSNHVLIDFMNAFYEQTKIPLDHIYTAKMVYAFTELVKESYFKKGSKVVLLHTGGLQGNVSISNQLKY
ncbi:MAG: 1-aminocyclopropane-1-carboxylate deaminase/D-cysteine desulfhydrase [Crocinitomicaceae bacterium]